MVRCQANLGWKESATARFWPWLVSFSVRTSLKASQVFTSCSVAPPFYDSSPIVFWRIQKEFRDRSLQSGRFVRTVERLLSRCTGARQNSQACGADHSKKSIRFTPPHRAVGLTWLTNGKVTSTMRRAAHPSGCTRCGAGAGRSAIRYQSLWGALGEVFYSIRKPIQRGGKLTSA